MSPTSDYHHTLNTGWTFVLTHIFKYTLSLEQVLCRSFSIHQDIFIMYYQLIHICCWSQCSSNSLFNKYSLIIFLLVLLFVLQKLEWRAYKQCLDFEPLSCHSILSFCNFAMMLLVRSPLTFCAYSFFFAKQNSSSLNSRFPKNSKFLCANVTWS